MTNSRRGIALAIGFVLVFGVGIGLAAGVPAQPKPQKEQMRIVSATRLMIKGDRYEAGKSTINYKDIVLSTDSMLVTGKGDKQTGLFTGAVKVVQPDFRLTCSTLEMNFKQEKGIATGNVLITREENRKDDKGKTKRVTTTVKGDKVEFLTGRKDFTALGSVYIEDGDTKAWSDKAAYSETAKRLTLSGRVRIVKADGSKVNAESVVYDTQSENIEVAGNAEIITFID